VIGRPAFWPACSSDATLIEAGDVNDGYAVFVRHLR
jgi:hypothetical protein